MNQYLVPAGLLGIAALLASGILDHRAQAQTVSVAQGRTIGDVNGIFRDARDTMIERLRDTLPNYSEASWRRKTLGELNTMATKAGVPRVVIHRRGNAVEVVDEA